MPNSAASSLRRRRPEAATTATTTTATTATTASEMPSLSRRASLLAALLVLCCCDSCLIFCYADANPQPQQQPNQNQNQLVQQQQLQAPRFTTHPSASGSIVSEGSTKILQCHALGYPQPTYRWLKDGVPVGDFSSSQFYRFHSTRREDAGSYQCIARNDAGSIFSEKSDVVVAYMGVFENTTEGRLTVISGHPAIFDMPAIESVPVPSVMWQSEDGPLSYDIKYAFTKANQLVILSADENDRKGYRAKATNTQLGKEESSAFVHLNVSGDPYIEVAPEIIVRPQDVKVKMGTGVVEMQCIANARPLHELETLWLKDGIAVETAGVRHTLSDPWNRTLALLQANSSHSGEYTCQVRLRSGGYPAVSASARLQILEPPVFFTPMRAETFGEFGGQVQLACDVVGEPTPQVKWFRNAESVDPHIESGRYSLNTDNTLVIKKLILDDAAMFQCLAINEAGENSASTWLRVKTSAPIMELPPQNVTALDGKDATISCRAVGSPNPNITWIYNETQLVDISSRVQILESGDLLISNIRSVDAGLYICVRANEAGSVKGEAYLSVLVRTQIIQPPVDTTVLLGLTATLQCKVSSDPSVPYNIDWYREGQSSTPISNSQRIGVQADGQLEIQAVRASDVGSYACVVTSPGGNETRAARLSVIELPFPPSNVKVERLPEPQQRSINVSWTPGFDGNSPISKFIIQRREVSELEKFVGPVPDPLLNWITELSNVSADQRWILLENLKAATVYQFRVSAVNRVGEGSPSEPSNVVELPQEEFPLHRAPSGPPVGFVGSARSMSEIITQWQPPLEEHRNGQILGYILRYRLFGYNNVPWSYQNITNEAQRNFLIQELITWKDYIVQIAAYNNMGVGVYTEGSKIKTKEGVPEAPPTNVKVEAINSTAARCRWTPPNPQQINGINQGYKIQAWQSRLIDGEWKDIERRMMTVPPSLIDPLAEQTAVLGGLEKYTEYNISVLCFTDPGDGVASVQVPVMTLDDVPDEVTALHFDDVSDRSVKVLWAPPRFINGILTGYTVRYQVKDRPDTLKTFNLTADDTELTVNQLQATTHYWFEIFAWTRKGSGTPKTATIQSGVEPVLPHAPTSLALSNIEAFSVVLQFTPGFDGNSSITKWKVEGQTARNMTWFTICEINDPDAETLTVTGLVPFTQYRLRLSASNVVGSSKPSEATKDFQTIQARPKHPPFNVTVRAMSAQQLRVRWIPLQQTEWYGNPRGYNISYKQLVKGAGSSKYLPRSVVIEDHTANSHVLDGLEEWTLYEVKMNACNDVGCSKESETAVERTREAVPSYGPLKVQANATTSTTVVVQWGEVPPQHRNGQIDGYKVFYAATDRGQQVLHKTIPNNATFTTTLTELKKFVVYHVQVLAYTRLGNGALSTPPIRVQTFEDTPGVPSNVSFPDVTLTMARIIWDVPMDPNGEILAYQVTYTLNGSAQLNYSREFPPSDRTFRATGLLPEKYYSFSCTAQTRLGWGKIATALVYTTNNRERPQAPSVPQISRSQIQAHQITFSWTPGRDGFAPLRYYTVEMRENEGRWQPLPERVDPLLSSYTALGLRPYMTYQFRIQATNDLGPSAFSKESSVVRTLPAAPAVGVGGLKVVPITTTSVRVQWSALETGMWNGDAGTGGYRILYQQLSDFPTALQSTPKTDVHGINENSVVLSDLQQDRNYEIVVLPFNSQGPGPATPPAAVYVGEAVPTGEPRAVDAAPISSTEVRLLWKPPKQSMQNGDILGYKIYYLVTYSPQALEPGRKWEEEIEVVSATATSHSLVFLDKFTEYRIQLLAFNPAGDGPRSAPITVKTLPGVPSAPLHLRFSDITMQSLEVTWDPPKFLNGEILGYLVTYETTEENEKFSKQVKQKVSNTTLRVQNLEEEVTYTFTVRAQTSVDYGPGVSENVTTGPQDGSPVAPRDLILTKTLSSVEMHWINGPSGRGPILGYLIEAKKREKGEPSFVYDSRWTKIEQTRKGMMQDFTVSYHILMPSTAYTFRVIAYNRYGISFPVYSKDSILTPSKLHLEYGYLQHKPFYRQTWFMVSLAATSIVIIVMVIAVLCVKSKSYKYKQEAQKTLEESMAMSIDERQELALELYRSRHGVGTGTLNSVGTLRSGTLGTLGRKSTNRPPPGVHLGKSPPRPSPASVAYHSDEESLKCYDENPDDSSVTEKPSEVSSSEASQHSESENESVRSDPHSFVNHYANVNDSLRQSWKKTKPVRNYSSYTDSEPEGSAVMSLNGGQIIVNNMARSRAPLPGFSSFV
ncbi:protein sidekick isoform X6 [Drosophila biarmipes]|uniref:protein sidekick isoform X6 n=1 Tax=Drosophila biarmipes TaxID=125945 RepID=UPI0021CCD6D8|nr:protein sidekick isoform X6 [Drosophila biarmipes]